MKIAIDAGHGGKDLGADFQGVLEKEICLSVAMSLADACADQGHLIAMTRTDDSYVAISTRAQIANFARADLFISLHMRADPDCVGPGIIEAPGTRIWISPGVRHARILADAIGREIIAWFPDEPWRGIKEEAFGVLKLTTMPTVLIEMGFAAARQASKPLDASVQMKIVSAIAQAVRDYLSPTNLAA